MRLLFVLLLAVTGAPAFALSPITETLIATFIPAAMTAVLSLLSTLTAAGAVLFVARVIYNKFAPSDFPHFDWKFDVVKDDAGFSDLRRDDLSHPSFGDFYSDNEFAARQRAAARLEARNTGASLSDEADYFPRLDDH